jgi:hypothetical protein
MEHYVGLDVSLKLDAGETEQAKSARLRRTSSPRCVTPS